MSILSFLAAWITAPEFNNIVQEVLWNVGWMVATAATLISVGVCLGFLTAGTRFDGIAVFLHPLLWPAYCRMDWIFYRPPLERWALEEKLKDNPQAAEDASCRGSFPFFLLVLSGLLLMLFYGVLGLLMQISTFFVFWSAAMMIYIHRRKELDEVFLQDMEWEYEISRDFVRNKAVISKGPSWS